MTTATVPRQASADAAPLVLIADDDGVVRRFLRLLLANQGYRLLTAGDGEAVLQISRRERPDLILLDVEMPDPDGYEVCRRLRADRDLAEVPIMMLTALTDRDARLRGIEAGADDFISKPFDATELAARVRTVTRLNRYRGVQNAARLAEQLETAAVVQQQLLPRRAPAIPGLDIVSRSVPASVIGGDYFDFLVRDATLYFAIADVSGHGVASALYMANARSALRTSIRTIADPLALAEAVNERMVEDAGDSGMFVSAVIGRYDPASGALAIVNCGHPPPVIVRAGGTVETVPASAPPLGWIMPLGARSAETTLSPGDLVGLYTDGVVEAEDAEERQFGAARLRTIWADHSSLWLDRILARTLDAVFAFRGTHSLADDLTVVMMRRHGGPAPA